MKKIIYFLTLLLVSITSYSADQVEIEETLKILDQQARCIGAIYENFDKTEEQEVYTKLYGSLVEGHRKFVEFSLEHEESGMQKIVDYVGSKDILIGMLLQGTIIRSDEYNDQYESERSGKTLKEFHRFVWNTNGCDAIYAGI